MSGIACSIFFVSLIFRAEAGACQALHRYDPRSYPNGSFHVSQRDYPIGKFTVRIIQAKKVYDPSSPPPSYCRAWLEVRDGGRVLRQAYFDDIDPVGSSFGIFLPQHQPLTDVFLALKEGDYDGRLLLVGEDGSLTNLPGGGLFLTPDKRFAIGSHGSDYESLFVIDMVKRRVVIDGKKEKLPGVDEWYMDKAGYFFTAEDDTGMPQNSKRTTFVIYRLDLKNLRVTKGTVEAHHLKSIRSVETVQWHRTSDCTSPP